ncbi:HigA family addiction module antitoxin [Dyella telluris]|uniref:HigA family addiction module antidote protein n=1 Tax=Dyella telluris TaxID=2763498 RepID=A0A7G8Q669_9GAMM|nr:HigA family addiction module antitoxin [Dyella telluris]QNK02277.1 HigA family addiction module antidote protein [Dyella telluris]
MIKNPVHPGLILQEDVLAPLELTVTTAAERLGVSRVALSRVLNGRAGISSELAIRLEKAGAGKAETWVKLQADYDLAIARKTSIRNVHPLAA